MSTITAPTHRTDVLRPLAAATAGAVTFAVTMTAGELFDLNADAPDAAGTSPAEVLAYVGIVLVAVVIAVVLAAWAMAGTPRRLSGTALGLAVAAALTFVAFWSGWPLVYGAVAVLLATEHRRRIGSFSGMSLSALIVGGAAFVAAAVFCVIG
jgi:lipopolysaccharide export LptBFGC system permease protein LptF